MFSVQERAFLQSQPLARIGTVSTDGQPTVDAVGFEFDGARFYIGGHRFQATRKYQNVVAGNTKVSLIIDDLKSIQPWQPRGPMGRLSAWRVANCLPPRGLACALLAQAVMPGENP